MENLAVFRAIRVGALDENGLDSWLLGFMASQLRSIEIRLALTASHSPVERRALEERLQEIDAVQDTLSSLTPMLGAAAGLRLALDELFPGRGGELAHQFMNEANQFLSAVPEISQGKPLHLPSLVERVGSWSGGRVKQLLDEEEARRRRRFRFWDGAFKVFYVLGSALFILGEWRRDDARIGAAKSVRTENTTGAAV